MSWKKKVVEKIDNESEKIFKLPDYQRTRLELIIVSFIIICFGVMIYLGAIVHNTFQTILYTLGILSMTLMFIQKSLKYQRLKFISQFQKRMDI